MPLTIDDFKLPDRDPIGMLAGKIKKAFESEHDLSVVLFRAIKKGDIRETVELEYGDHGLVEAGYLERNENGFRLTEKSIELLFAYYGKTE